MINDSPLAAEFREKGRSEGCPVIDMHGHMGPFSGIWFPRESPEAMIGTMDSAGVRLLCFAHHAAFFSPEAGEAGTLAAVRKYPERLRAYFAVNPHYPRATNEALARWEEHSDVYVGFKLHPSWHNVPIYDAAYEGALSFAAERRLPVLTHTWSDDPNCGAAAVAKAAQRHPDCRLLLAHCFHDHWDDAIAVAREHKNVYLELTAVLDNRPAVEKFVEAGFSKRMLFGTDLPWFDPHHGIGALLSADITDEDRRDILHRNAERLLAAAGVTLQERI
ncbi:MAG: amidohydrolase family protein [Planctomycetota bacterium]